MRLGTKKTQILKRARETRYIFPSLHTRVRFWGGGIVGIYPHLFFSNRQDQDSRDFLFFFFLFPSLVVEGVGFLFPSPSLPFFPSPSSVGGGTDPGVGSKI